MTIAVMIMWVIPSLVVWFGGGITWLMAIPLSAFYVVVTKKFGGVDKWLLYA
jgi:hypothetical protein